jgi:uncharacterized membrane protein
MSHGTLALVVAFWVVAFHLAQVQMLSGSIGEFWRRRDSLARLSKAFFGLSLFSCLLVWVSPLLGLPPVFAFTVLHVCFSMNEWKR